MTDAHRDDWTAEDDALHGGNAPDAGGTALPGLFRRAVMVVFSPGDLFPALAARPKWFGAMVLAGVLGATVGLAPSEALMEQWARNAPGQEISIPVALIRLMSLLALPFTLLQVAVVSGLTYVALVFVRGDEATFKQHMSVISHSLVINHLGAVIFLALAYAGMSPNAERFSVGGLLPFLPEEGFLARFLGQVQLIWLWSAVVAGLGLSLLDPRRRWAPTAAVTVGLTLAFALLSAVIVSALSLASS